MTGFLSIHHRTDRSSMNGLLLPRWDLLISLWRRPPAAARAGAIDAHVVNRAAGAP
jgi:hypothetical protein